MIQIIWSLFIGLVMFLVLCLGMEAVRRFWEWLGK